MSAIFRLQLSYVSADTVQVRVEESASGEPRQVLAAPMPAPARKGLIKVLETGSLDEQPLTPAELAGLRSLGLIVDGRLLGPTALHLAVGQALCDVLLPPSREPDHDVQGAFRATLAQAERAATAVALQLRFDRDAVDLAALPWELLVVEGQHVVASGRVQLTRYITFGQATAAYPISDRLDILSIVARPSDALSLDASAERDAIAAALGDLQARRAVRIQLLTPPTFDALVAALNARSYHMVHFDGHGLLARRCPFCQQYQPANSSFCTTPGCGARLDDAALQGCLLFERSASDHRADLISAPDLGAALAGRQVRLLVASACQSAAVGGSDVFASIGPRLVLAGVPAVVAMQFSLPQSAAVAFSSEFYASLARGEAVAAAASAGRRALLSSNAWHIPALYLRSRDGQGQLFRWRDPHHTQAELLGGAGLVRIRFQPAGAPAPDWEALYPRQAAPYKFFSAYETGDHAAFFGRQEATFALLGEVLQRPLVVLHGPSGIGKTSLVNAGLVPELLSHGYLALVVTGCSDPIQALIDAVGQSQALHVDVGAAAGLADLVATLQREVGHPLLVVFDQLEQFLHSASPDQRASLAAQLAACATAPHALPVRILLVVAEDSVGPLAALDEDLPTLWGAPVSLGPLSREQARLALEGPLARHDPAMSYEPGWLHDRLLPDLAAEQGGQVINPTHLQIVAHELHRRAVQAGVRVLSRDLYPVGGTAAILSGYLEQSLRRRFPQPEARELARSLLKLMVSQAGERVSVRAAAVAATVGAPLAQVQAALEALRADGLVALGNDGLHALSHHTLAAEVRRWFNREEALVRCAQETLDRAWDDWYTQQSAGQDAAAPELLVGANRLAEIRARLDHLAIDAPRLCLLLHSAVRQQAGIPFWAQHLAGDPQCRALLAAIERGETGQEPAGAAIPLAAAALGLDEMGPQALARAAAGHPAGHVRHTAALALAAAGLDQVNRSLPVLAAATPKRRGWRRAQALAQMRAAGFAIPQTTLGLQLLVAIWNLGIRVWRRRWPVLIESLAAGLGASVGLGIALLVSVPASPAGFWPLFALRSVLFMPMGFAIGAITVAVACIAGLAGAPSPPRRQAVRQALGMWLGFVLGLLLLWWPLDAFSAQVVQSSQLGSGYESERTVARTYILGGGLWGLGIALGYYLLAGQQSRLSLARALVGAGLGGALGCWLAWRLRLGVPLVEPAGWLVEVQVVLAGFGLGGGLAAGRAAGARLWAAVRQGRHNPPAPHSA